MKSLVKNYGSTLSCLVGVIIGAIIGGFWPSATRFIKPVGDIFLNLLFSLVVPLVFFSIALSFQRLKSKKQIGGILLRALVALLIISFCCGGLAYISALFSGPLASTKTSSIVELSSKTDIASAVSGALSVSDFPQLFSKLNLLPLIIFSALIGLGTAAAGDKGKAFSAFLESGNDVIVKTLGLLMKLAPIGLACYFAATVSEIGSGLLEGYLRIFVVYCLLCVLIILVLFPLLILIARGRTALRAYIKHIIPPSITALATASSSVAMPLNIEAAQKTGIEEDIAKSVVPLATNLLKGGSVALGVFKLVFLMEICNLPIAGIGMGLWIICIAALSAIVSGAVTNGGVTGELLICTILGLDPQMAGIIMIIGTIADVPATLVNSQSTVVAAALADPYSLNRVKKRS